MADRFETAQALLDTEDVPTDDLAYAVVAAILEVESVGADPHHDAPLRLLVHQLALRINVPALEIPERHCEAVRVVTSEINTREGRN